MLAEYPDTNNIQICIYIYVYIYIYIDGAFKKVHVFLMNEQQVKPADAQVEDS